jgi:hypothetical protein
VQDGWVLEHLQRALGWADVVCVCANATYNTLLVIKTQTNKQINNKETHFQDKKQAIKQLTNIHFNLN